MKRDDDPLAKRARGGDSFYHPELDGLRFFAFLGVFLYHAFPIEPARHPDPVADEIGAWVASVFKAGETGVDLFFVLSAYLITELLLREHVRLGRIDVVSFYVRRTLRIWPLYYAFLAFAVFFESHLLGNEGLRGPFALGFTAFAGNWVITAAGTLPSSAALVLWTVAIEEQFYLLWPLALRWVTPNRVVALAVAVWGLGVASRTAIVLFGGGHFDIHFNSLCRLDAIGAGALVAGLLRGRALRSSALVRWTMIVVGVGVTLAAVRIQLEPRIGLAKVVVYSAWAASSVLVLLGVLRPLGERGGLFAWPPLVFLGRISYGLYVVHLLAILVADRIVGPHLGIPLRRALLALAMTTALASVSYYALERPFLALKLRFTHVLSRPGG